jgi:hypothetical protein
LLLGCGEEAACGAVAGGVNRGLRGRWGCHGRCSVGCHVLLLLLLLLLLLRLRLGLRDAPSAVLVPGGGWLGHGARPLRDWVASGLLVEFGERHRGVVLGFCLEV